MSAPFAPGDVVVCVDDRAHPLFGPPPVRRGRNYRVTGMAAPPLGKVNGVTGRPEWGVDLAGVDPSPAKMHGAYRFRKIDDEVTEEFRTQLKSLSKPKERTKA